MLIKACGQAEARDVSLEQSPSYCRRSAPSCALATSPQVSPPQPHISHSRKENSEDLHIPYTLDIIHSQAATQRSDDGVSRSHSDSQRGKDHPSFMIFSLKGTKTDLSLSS